MRFAVVVASLCLAGCPGALVASMVMHEPDKGLVHPPNPADYEAWVGVSKPQIETHHQFSLLSREIRHISDGSEMWVLRYCPGKSREDCCAYQFVIAGNTVQSYRTAGACQVDCSSWPESKVQACLRDKPVVPENYGRNQP